jgi:integrase
MRFSTGKRDVEDAKRYACEAFDEAKYRERLGFALMVKRFDEIAKYCCEDMRRDLAAGVGKKVYTAYIAVIETYLVPFFGQMFLTSITHKQIAEFELWRNAKLKRKPKTSTLLTFASAFSRICATAVEQGWVSATAKFPKLNVRGERGGVRPAFTDKEVTQLRQHLTTWHTQAKGYTAEMRLLLRDLVDLLIQTGMRQGTESMGLMWKHIEWHEEKGVRYLRMWVKGKTGERWLIAKHECVNTLKRLQANQPDIASLTFDELIERRLPLLVFRFTDNNEPFEMNKVFKRLLIETDLLKGQADKDRTLYSLRHTYATNELLSGTDIHTLAKQMGTSVLMLERHYSKLTATMAADKLAGNIDNSSH